ncbi:MAG: hypothetical protein R3B84_24450 [Zavarzinella sp.]
MALIVITLASAGLSAATGGVYGLCLRILLTQPEWNWQATWIFAALLGGACGFGCGVLRAIELAKPAQRPSQ